MQAITPVTTSQLLRKDQEALLKLEIYVDPYWINICNGCSFLLSACDTTTDWLPSAGGVLSIDTDDKKEGTGSLKNTVAAPIATDTYFMRYNPALSWDWSNKEYIIFWFKCDRASTAFTDARLVIWDTLVNWRWWSLTFSAGEWTSIKLLLSTGDDESIVPPDLALIDLMRIQFTAADNTPFYKKIDDLRIEVGLEDRKNYLKSISISRGGAQMSPNPIAASLSAEISNEDGIFHPKHPTSAYTDYFKAGRKVRIFVGAKYDDVDYYWQRIIGYIDMPKFSLGKILKLNISGLDYTKLLADTIFKKTAVPPDNYWGATATFDSVETTQVGDELYIAPGGDAAEITLEDNNVDNWAIREGGGATLITSELDIGGFSDFEIKFVADPVGLISNAWFQGVCAVNKGTEYFVTFKYTRTAGDDFLSVYLFDGAKKIGGVDHLDPAVNGVFETASFSFTPSADEAAVDLHLFCLVVGAPSTWRIDNISIKSVTSQVVHKYEMPDACNGVHYVELDEGAGFKPVWPGQQKDGEEGWFYDAVLNQFYFAEGKIVENGNNNLKIYYYTEQLPENVVADILVIIGLYINQAAALTAMDNPDTGVTVDQVWFKSGSKMLDAIKKICERTDYRFYFKWDGTPVFKPVPNPELAGDEDLVFRRWNIKDPKYYEDRNEIRNRIVIEGLKQALPEGADEAMSSELKGQASNGVSIAEYGEHSLSIRNDLFQDQDSIDAMCVTLLARYKDPKWYFDFKTPFNPAPLEIWDTVEVELMLKGPVWPGGRYGTFRYSSGVLYGGSGTLVNVRGLIRDIKIDKHAITYKCEEVV